jgi:microcompartment protein CcmK/EutM
VLNSDGRAARELIGDDKSPVRFFVIGIVDEV